MKPHFIIFSSFQISKVGWYFRKLWWSQEKSQTNWRLQILIVSRNDPRFRKSFWLSQRNYHCICESRSQTWRKMWKMLNYENGDTYFEKDYFVLFVSENKWWWSKFKIWFGFKVHLVLKSVQYLNTYFIFMKYRPGQANWKFRLWIFHSVEI